MCSPAIRLAYLATSRVPSPEANSIHVMRMAHAMAANGAEVLLVTRPGDRPLGDAHAYYETSGFELRAIAHPGLPGWRPWGRAIRVRREVEGWGADFAYGRDPHALLLAAGHGTAIGYELHELGTGRRRRLEARLFAQSHLRLVTFITDALQQDYLAAHPELRDVPRLVAPDGADPAPAVRRAPTDRPRVGYVGHLYEGRGIDIITTLAARIPEADFEVVGGSEEDVERYRAPAGDLSNLQFVGAVPPGTVGARLDAFDVVVAPYQVGLRTARGGDTSRWMSPLKIFEYMAHGLAIVASSLPALQEVLVHGTNALLVSPRDVEAWERAVRQLLDDEGLRSALADRARADLEARYTWSARARRIVEHMTGS